VAQWRPSLRRPAPLPENGLRELFLLDPEVVYLNHGSYGACPKPVLDAYQRWQLELERQPVEFLAKERRYAGLIDEARARLADYLGADVGNLVFVPNASSALNGVARSLGLEAGDEVLASDQEYGGMDMLWRFVCEQTGAQYVRRPFEQLWDAVTDRTRVLFVSHVSWLTGVVLPVEELCRRARERGILTIVDGAHAPGQIPLELESLGADAYAGNCHKWLCAPKGSAFLYLRPELHDLFVPAVVSWDWEDGEGFAGRQRWQGTHDPSAYLSVPAAIDFQAEHGWDGVRRRCHQLAEAARDRLTELTGIEPLAPADSFVQMVGAALPPCDAADVKRRLYDEHRVEVPVWERDGQPLIRVSFQGYNDEADLDRLVGALAAVLR
jgi:isopenicillin-N epimerase